MKYEIGDKVTIKENIVETDDDVYGYMPSEMDGMAGEKLTIKNIEGMGGYTLVECTFDFGYDERWLEYYEKPFQLELGDFLV